MSATAAQPETIASPPVIHNCPNCSHWLPDGTLACPDCQTLTYGEHLTELAMSAQELEQQQKWVAARDRWKMALLWLPQETRQSVSIQAHIAELDGRLRAEEDTKAKWTKRLGPFAPVALFLIKAKSYWFLIFKLKFLVGFLAYFGLYWVAFGWKFAVAFMLTLTLHEMGHYVAVKRRGWKVDLPMFLPGLGAYVRWQGKGATVEDLAEISLAGPLAGFAVALVSYGIFFATHSPFFHLMAYLGAWINFVNLFAAVLPFIALDGALAAFALSRVQRALIAATSLIFFGLTVSQNVDGDLSGPHTRWSFLIIGGSMAWRAMGRDAPEQGSGKIFALFQGLVVALGVLMLASAIPGM
ncbi:MAG: site-2 protease family protein [Acidobacteriota bacterium]